MDILDEGFGATPEPVIDMGSLVETRSMGSYVPPSAVRNRAATTALLTSTPSDIVEKYRTMVLEEQEGVSITYDKAQEQLAQANKGKDMKHILNLLGDPSIPIEQKKQIMDVTRQGQFREEPAITLRTQALSAESKGESPIGEFARTSTASMMQDIQRDAENRQRLVNAANAARPDIEGIAGTVNFASGVAIDVLPLSRNIVGAKVSATLGEKTGVPTSLAGWIKNLLLPGSTDKEVMKRLENVPLDKREEFVQNILGSIKESASVFPNDNYYAQFQKTTKLLESPQASTSEEWVDNAFTLLDLFWIGSELKGAAKGTVQGAESVPPKGRRPGSVPPGTSDVPFSEVHKADWELVQDPVNPFAKRLGEPRKALPAPRIEDQIKRIEMNSVVHNSNPVSPFNIVSQSNPEQARSMYAAIVKGTDEVAEALAGTTREQAIINNTFPQVATESGAVEAKVNMNPLDEIDPDILAVTTNTGATRYTPTEFQQGVEGITKDFRNSSGLRINDNMTTFVEDGDHLIISAHYDTPGGAFNSAKEALDQAKYALRRFGIKDNEISLVKREGIDYVPTNVISDNGDYMIRVQARLPVTDADVVNFDMFDVKRNFSDRLSITGTERSGSLSGWIMPPEAMLDRTLTGSFSIAADQSINLENVLLEPIRVLRNNLEGMAKDRVAKFEAYIIEANEKGLGYDPIDLATRGFTPRETHLIERWKDIWDGHYYLENNDLVRTVKSEGFQIFEHNGNKLVAKSVPKNQNIGRVLDPSTNVVRTLSPQELDDLYSKGGSYAQFRRPIDINGASIEHMVVRNTPNEYLRGLRDTDALLNYRPGYYTVNYKKGSRIIDEYVTDAHGKETRRTVGVAGNSLDAEMFKNSQQKLTGNRHEVREDSRAFQKDSDTYWDLSSASGRIAQRYRGKPLQSPVGINQLGTGVHVDTPMESAVRAAKSLADRTLSRPMLETAKRRFVQQYGDLLEANSNGVKDFPPHRDAIVDHTNHTSKRVADARTTYGYIRAQERGFINSADQGVKGVLTILANMLGGASVKTGSNVLAKVEQSALWLSQQSVSQGLKGIVYHSYISLSLPVRQWIVQPFQANRMAAYNAIGVANGGVLKRSSAFFQHKVLGGYKGNDPEIKAFLSFVETSGVVAGVDKNSLVRGMGVELSDAHSGLRRGLETVASIPQRVGFDFGESANQVMHLAAVHEKWTREGVDLTNKTKRDLALIEARALTLNLNRAGEFHYTQSSASSVLQFLQMPHKAWTQGFNRQLDGATKAKVFGWDLVMLGPPAAMVTSMMLAAGVDGEDVVPNNPTLREIYTDGLMSAMINNTLSMFDVTGEKRTNIDFSALNGFQMDGWAKMYHAFLDDGYFGAFAASPAGQILAISGVNGSSRNGRIPKALITMGRFFNVIDEVDPEEPTKFSAVVNDALKITSGWTTLDKANMMLEVRKGFDKIGRVSDTEVTIPEAVFAYAGFGTKSTAELYSLGKEVLADKKEHEKNLTLKYKAIAEYYADQFKGKEGADVEHAQKVSSLMMRTFKNEADIAFVRKLQQRDMQDPTNTQFKMLFDAAGMPNNEKSKAAWNMSGLPQEQIDILNSRSHDMQKVFNAQKGK